MKVTKLVVFSLFLLSASFFAKSQYAVAAYTDLNHVLSSEYSVYISNEAPSEGVGNFTPSITFLIYRDAGSGVDTFYMVQPSTSPLELNCSSFDYYARSVDDGLTNGASSMGGMYAIGGTSPALGDSRRGSCQKNDLGLGISGLSEPTPREETSIWSLSKKFPGKEVIAVNIRLKDTGYKNVGSGTSRFIDIYSDPYIGDAKVSQIGNPYSKTSPSFQGGVGLSLSRYAPPQYDNLNVYFSAPCNVESGSKQVYWKDADSGNDGREVRAILQEYKNNNWSEISSKNAGNDNDVYGISFLPKKGRKYRIVFTNTRGGDGNVGANTIKVWAPFDSASPDCPPDPSSGGSSSGCDSLTVGLVSNRRAKVSVWNFNDGDNPQKTQANRLVGNGNADSPRVITTNQTINFSPSKKYVIVDIDYENHIDTNGNGELDRWQYDASLDFRRTYVCFSTSCSVTIFPNIGSGLKASRGYDVGYTVTNTNNIDPDGPGPVQPGNWTIPDLFPVSGGGAFVIDRGGEQIRVGALSPGESYYAEREYSAQNGIGTETRNASILYSTTNLVSFPGCSDSKGVYREYEVVPNGSVGLDDLENPTNVAWTASGAWSEGKNPGVSIDLSVTAQIQKKNENDSLVNPSVATVINNESRSFAPWSQSGNSSTSRATFGPGDKACINVIIADAYGWVGPGGNKLATENREANSGCQRVGNRPYVRFYGGDVFAGGNFDGLTAVNGTIKTNHRTTSNIGSGVEYAMFALGSVDGSSSSSVSNGFASRFLHSAPQYDTLNFASSPKGGFGTDHTIARYSNLKPLDAQTVTGNPMSPAGATTPSNRYIEGDITLNGDSNFTGRHAIFVRGNVYINGPIKYNVSNIGDVNNIPNFALIVTGNIYISSSVDQLDGLYVAEPDAPDRNGVIYTCASGVNAALPPTMGNCGGTKLTVNGAFIAQNVQWLRSIGTLASGSASEAYSSANIAEVIRFSPEYLIGYPAYISSSSGPGQPYASYNQLSPRLPVDE
jgi:hypothetical protein